MEIELERTFLLKYKPEDLEKSPCCEITDIYFPREVEHPVLRLRNRNNEKFEITKKVRISEIDLTEQEEHTIILSKKEYEALAKVDGRKIRKIRYYYEMPGGQKAEIDIFKDKFEGLSVVDFEFKTKEEKEKFTAPDFCLVEISQDEKLAGGILSGGSYAKIEKHLKQYNYKKI